MAHARDFDDTHDEAVAHTAVSVIPAALAVAEERGNVDGRVLLKAIVMGVDVFIRMIHGADWAVYESGWMPTALMSYFAASVSAGIVAGFDTEQIVNTCGIVLSKAGGSLQAIADSALTKRMQPGFGAEAAVQAVAFTRIGVRGCKNVLEGDKGFYQQYYRGNYTRENILKELGKRWYINELSYKPYPCCRYTHSGILCALKILEESWPVLPNTVHIR